MKGKYIMDDFEISLNLNIYDNQGRLINTVNSEILKDTTVNRIMDDVDYFLNHEGN